MKGVKHYTEDGEYTGSKHKMPDGKSHTGKTHSKTSKVISHKPDGPFQLKGVSSPLACWDKYKRDYSKTEFSENSCVPK